MLPGKTFDAGKTLEAMTAQRATVLVATPAQVAALSAALAEDAAKPAPKRAYDLSSLRAGLVSECGACCSGGGGGDSRCASGSGGERDRPRPVVTA